MAVTHKEAGLTPVEMLEHLILTRNLISGNIACSFDSWVQKKARRPFKAARARELRTATIVANRRTGRVRSIAKANPKLAGWFVGQVLKATGGKANPAAVNDILKAKLGLS